MWLLLVLAANVFAAVTQASSLTIQCHSNGSINIHQMKTYDAEIFVVGNSPQCSDAMRHFRVDTGNHSLNTSCRSQTGYLLEVLEFNQTKDTGFTSTVYNVTCAANGSANPSLVTMAPTKHVSYLDEVVLPKLNIAIVPANTTLNSSMTSASLSSVYLGQAVMLTIYHDRSQGRASYMLVPTRCEAYPTDNSSVKLTLPQDDQKRCTKQDALIGQFTTEQVNDVDVAWAPLYGFLFADYPDSDIFIECAVLVCPTTQGSSGGCKTNSGCVKHNRRRKRNVSTSRDIIHAKAVRARTRVKLRYNLASSASVTTLTSMLLPVAVVMTML